MDVEMMLRPQLFHGSCYVVQSQQRASKTMADTIQHVENLQIGGTIQHKQECIHDDAEEDLPSARIIENMMVLLGKMRHIFSPWKGGSFRFLVHLFQLILFITIIKIEQHRKFWIRQKYHSKLDGIFILGNGFCSLNFEK